MRSFRTRLQAAFVLLGITAVAVTGWESSATATQALRDATYERLTAITETKARQLERYFQDAGNHVLALSSDASTIDALEQFEAAWPRIPLAPPGATEQLAPWYRGLPPAWVPQDPRVRSLQLAFLANNPYPERRWLLLNADGIGPYASAHTRFHPTLQRYQAAFGFYDTLLLNASGTLLYSVLKEIDLGANVLQEPYRQTSLSHVFERAMSLREPESYVVEDYKRYPPSHFAPAAFYAAPIWRRGVKAGVLAIQISSTELNRAMAAGIGSTGQAFIVGPDGLLRSDLRSVPPPAKSSILETKIPEELQVSIRGGESGTHAGHDQNGAAVLRSHTPLQFPGLGWVLVAEIQSKEALAPLWALQAKLMLWAALLAVLTLLAASLVARRVTQPVLALVDAAARIAKRDFHARLPVSSHDEIGQLAVSFNRMAEELDKTTVSKSELETLAGRLITAQEEERTRIARELHDDITQRLAALAIEIGRLERAAPSAEISRLKQAMARLADDVHDLSRELHHTTLDDLGLVAAIEAECRAFFERGCPPVAFTSDGDFESVPRDVQLALYRVVQEGLRNVQRHSGAEDVSIDLRRLRDSVELRIEDNGRGFDPADRRWRRGVGLASMEERATLLGGTCRVTSAPGAGTRVEVSIPVRIAT